MQRIVIAAAVCVIALGAAGAQAKSLGRACTTAPESQYLSTTELKARIEAQGYTVREIEIEKACAEVYALDKTGAKVELFLDPTNGSIVGSK
jgi:hypothetical protein